MDSPTDKLRNEILAVMWRYAQESDVTIIETIKSAHQAAERIAQIALDANQFLSEMQEAALEAGKPTKGQIITSHGQTNTSTSAAGIAFYLALRQTHNETLHHPRRVSYTKQLHRPL